MHKILLFILSFHCMNAFSAKISLEDLIKRIEFEKQKIELTRPKPLINGASLKLEDDKSFKEGDVDLELKVVTDNYMQYKIKSELYENQKSRKEIIQKIFIGDQFKELVSIYLSLSLLQNKIKLTQELIVMLEDKIKVYQRLVKKGLVPAQDYFDTIEDLDLKVLEQENNKVEKESLISKLNIIMKSNYKESQLDFSKPLLTIPKIKKKFKNRSRKHESLSIKLARLSAKRLELERKLEIEEDNKILESVAIGFNQSQLPSSIEYYDGKGDWRSRQSLTLKFNFNIPYFDSNMKRADNTIDSFLKIRKGKVEYSNSVSEFNRNQGQIKNLIKAVDKIENSLSIKEAKRFMKIYAKRKGTSPLRILSTNEFILKKKLLINEYKNDLFLKYFEFMYELGELDISEGKLVIK